MAEMLNKNEMMLEMEIPFEPDSLAEMVQSYFQQAKEYRVDDEQIWKEAHDAFRACLLYTSPSPRDKRQSRMPSSA